MVFDFHHFDDVPHATALLTYQYNTPKYLPIHIVTGFPTFIQSINIYMKFEMKILLFALED